jgi:DNA-directed RNA polymerase III subunit RPC4
VSRTITGSRSTNTIRIGTPTTGSGTSTPSFKTEGGMNIKEEIPEPVYPEEVDGGDAPPRIDIETINLVSDDEEEDGITDRSRANKGKGRSYGMNKGSKPVRLYRAEHKERITIVNTESAAASLGDKNKQTAESVAHEASATNGASGEKDDIDQGFTRDGKPWKGAWRDEEVKIKPEPEATTTNNIDDISDEIPVPIKESDSPKATRKQPLKQAPPTPKKPKVKEKPVLQTEEDRAEYARQQEDIRILTEELGNLQRPTGENADGEPAAAAAENGAQNVKDKEGRLYLFQFPPVLPPLIDQAKKDAADQDVEMGDVTGVENGDPAAAAQENQNEVDVLIKNEDGTLVAPPVNTTAPLIPEPGHIGRLIVRKSGKVELDWGGTILKLGRGVEATFLTTTVLVDSSDEVQVKTEGGGGGAFGGKEKKEEVLHGSAVGMGRVMGKFVAVPDFDSMLDLE